jgi:hypothetical protein
MRLWRMAAGGRVFGQACVSAVPRCWRGSTGGAIVPTPRKCHISLGFALRRAAR